MIVTLALALTILPPTVCIATADGTGLPGQDLEHLFRSGKTYLEFRDAARNRVESWKRNYADAQVADAVLTRASAVQGTWYLLVVAEDACGDSANTIPYLARLVDLVRNLDMRIITSKAGREIMEAHRTPDGRAATPTVLLLDERFVEAGCWVERPSTLQKWFLESEKTLAESELYRQKYAWYAEDAGRETVREIVEMMEVAGRGETKC